LKRIYEKVTEEEAQERWEEVYEYHKDHCGHSKENRACMGKDCFFKARMNHTHIIAGFVLPFWYANCVYYMQHT
jgi:hypothetical protein